MNPIATDAFRRSIAEVIQQEGGVTREILLDRVFDAMEIALGQLAAEGLIVFEPAGAETHLDWFRDRSAA